MYRKVFGLIVLLTLFCFAMPFMVFSDTGTPSTRKRQTWTAQQTFRNGVVIRNDDLEVKNSSNDKVFGVEADDGKPQLSWKSSYLVVDTEAEAEAKSTAYNVYFINSVGYAGHTNSIATIAGVSFYFPSGTTSMDGFTLKIVDISESGTTDILLVPADDAIQGSGVTDGIWTDQTVKAGGVTRVGNAATKSGFVYDVIDVKGEMLEFTYVWAAGGGTWYQTDRK